MSSMDIFLVIYSCLSGLSLVQSERIRTTGTSLCMSKSVAPIFVSSWLDLKAYFVKHGLVSVYRDSRYKFLPVALH